MAPDPAASDPSAPASTVLALDVASTSVRARVVDRAGAVHRQEQIAAPTGIGDLGAVDAVLALVRRMSAPGVGARSAGGPGSVSAGGVSAAAVVVDGFVDPAAGTIRYSAPYGWHNLPLADLVAVEIGGPVRLESRVRAVARAEGCSGAARGVGDWLYLDVGQEIVAAATVGSRLQDGATGAAGEVGHLPIYPFGRLCRCGQRGCVEAYASVTAMSAQVREISGRTVSVADIAARVGVDPLIDEVWQQSVAALGLALTMYVMMADPELIVLGGELAGVEEVALPALRRELRARLLWRQSPRITVAALGPDAVLDGAVSLARAAADRPS